MPCNEVPFFRTGRDRTIIKIVTLAENSSVVSPSDEQVLSKESFLSLIKSLLVKSNLRIILHSNLVSIVS